MPPTVVEMTLTKVPQVGERRSAKDSVAGRAASAAGAEAARALARRPAAVEPLSEGRKERARNPCTAASLAFAVRHLEVPPLREKVDVERSARSEVVLTSATAGGLREGGVRGAQGV